MTSDSADRWPGEALADRNLAALSDPEHRERGRVWREQREREERWRRQGFEADERRHGRA